MKLVTPAYIRELRAMLDTLTPGPWVSYVEGRDHESGSNFIMTGAAGARGEDIELIGATPADQDFVARARQEMPLLLDEIERLHGLLGGAQSAAE
jgi:hypothetical protein